MSILHNCNIDSMQSLSKSQLFPFFFFPETGKKKLILKFIWKCKGPSIAKAILKKNNKVGDFTLNGFKNLLKNLYLNLHSSVIPNIHKLTTKQQLRLWYRHKNRQTAQWNRIERLEINPYILGQLTWTWVSM